MILPYVYRAVNTQTGEFYIGFRKANKVNASFDIGVKYFSSSKHVKENKLSFSFEVMAEFFDSESAFKFEQQTIEEHFNNPLCLNKMFFSNINDIPHFKSDPTILSSSVRKSWNGAFERKKKLGELMSNLNAGKVHSKESNLKRSINGTKENSPPRKCCCTICHRNINIDSLTVHYNTHFSKQIHSKICEWCGMEVHGKSNYSQHHGNNCKKNPLFKSKEKRTYQRIKVTCICCRVTRNLPEHTRHIKKNR